MRSLPQRPTRRRVLRYCKHSILGSVALGLGGKLFAAEEVMPKHITPPALQAVRKGLDYLARSQSADGSWQEDSGGRAYPVAVTGLCGMALLANGNTSTRGRYAPQVEKAVQFLLG